MKNRRQTFRAVCGSIALALSSTLHAAAAPPNFVFILGEGSGWSSSSVQMEARTTFP